MAFFIIFFVITLIFRNFVQLYIRNNMKCIASRNVAFLLFVLVLASSCHRMELPAYHVDGMFFRTPPPEKSIFKLVKSNQLSSLRDLEGNLVWDIVPEKGAKIPEEAMVYRIPDKRVKNREEFLYNKMASEEIHKMQMASALNLDRPRTLKVGESLPGDFQLLDLEETVWNKERLKDKIVVINLWFSSCGPCLKEFPILSQWKEELPDVTFLSVDFEKKEIVSRIVKERNFTWIHLYDDNYFCKYLDGEGFPFFIVLDKQGVIRYFGNGATDAVRGEVLKTIQTLRNEDN